MFLDCSPYRCSMLRFDNVLLKRILLFPARSGTYIPLHTSPPRTPLHPSDLWRRQPRRYSLTTRTLQTVMLFVLVSFYTFCCRLRVLE